MKRADGCREGAECFWNSAEDTGGRLLVNDEKREEQGLKERKASPIREHERISVFSFLGFQKKRSSRSWKSPSLPLARRKRISPFSGN